MLAKNFKRTLAIVCAFMLMMTSLCVFTVSLASGESTNLLANASELTVATGAAATFADGKLTAPGGEFANVFAGVSLDAAKTYKYEFTLTMGEGDYNIRIPIRHTGDFEKGQWISLWGAGFGQVRLVADYWGGTLLTDSSVCGDTLLESGKTYKFTVVTSATDMIVSIDGVEKVRATGAAAITGAGTVGFGANNGNFTVSDFSLTEVAAVEEPAATNLLEGATSLTAIAGTVPEIAADGSVTVAAGTGEFAAYFNGVSLEKAKSYKYEFKLTPVADGDYNFRLPIRYDYVAGWNGGAHSTGQWISMWGTNFDQVRLVSDYWGSNPIYQTDSAASVATFALKGETTYAFTVETSATELVVFIDGTEVVRAANGSTASAVADLAGIGLGTAGVSATGGFKMSDFALYEIGSVTAGTPSNPGDGSGDNPGDDSNDEEETPAVKVDLEALLKPGENLVAEADRVGVTVTEADDNVDYNYLVPNVVLEKDGIYLFEFDYTPTDLGGAPRFYVRHSGNFTEGHFIALTPTISQVRLNSDLWTNAANLSVGTQKPDFEAGKTYKISVVTYPTRADIYIDGYLVVSGLDNLPMITNGKVGFAGWNGHYKATNVSVRKAGVAGDDTVGMTVSGNLVAEGDRTGATVTEENDGADHIVYLSDLKLEADRTYLYEFDLTFNDLGSDVRIPVRFAGSFTESQYVGFNPALNQIRINCDYWTLDADHLSVATFTFEKGKTYKVKLAAYKNQINVYIDGLLALKGEANLPTVTDGQLGYGGYNAHYTIANLSVVAELNEEDKAAVSNYNAKYALIGTVTLQSGDAIKAARDAYDALTSIQKTCVDVDSLVADEEYYQILVDKSQQGAHSEDGKYYNITTSDLHGWNHWGPPNTDGLDWLTFANASTGVRFTWNDTGTNVRMGINRPFFLDGFHAEFSNLTLPTNSRGAMLALYIADLDPGEQYTQYLASIKYYPFTLVVDMENGKLLLVRADGTEDVLAESDKLTIEALKGADWEVKIRRITEGDSNSDWKVVVNGVEGTVPNTYFAELTRLSKLEEAYLTICPWGYNKSFSLDLVSIHGGFDVCADEISDEQLETIEKVNSLIASIGEITPDKGDIIGEALEAYDSLDNSLKMLVGGYDTLVRAAAVFEVVKAIDDIGTVTLDSVQAIVSAKEKFQALDETNRALVTNYTELTKAEKTLYALQNEFSFDNALKFEGTVGVYDGQDIDNSALIPVILPDDQVVMEDSGFGIQSPDWVKTLIIEEMNPYAVLAPEKMGTGMETKWDGQSEGLFETDLAIKVLDHLAETGVNGLWLTPINDRGVTGNGYGNYGMHSIDPMLTGTNDYEEGWAVFKKFVDEAHKRNIRVFIDAVTWGTVKEAPLYTEHPDWYTGGEAWGGFAWDWSNQGLRDWYVKTCVEVALKSGIDGWRCDCEPGVTGYDIYAAIRAKLLEQGKKVATYSETGNDALGNGFDFGEHFLHWDNPNEWSANKMFLDGRYNMVEAIKNPIETPIIGTQMGIALGECASQRFYGGLITCHDYTGHGVLGRTVNAGYHSIFAPFIPIWYIGEEFNNVHKQLYYGNYMEVIDLNEIETNPEQKAFFNNYKQMIRIRRTYTDLFEYFPEHLYDTNLCAVEVFGTEWLQAYARYANGRAAIVVGNNNTQEENDDFTVVVPFEEAGIVGDDATVYTVTELMSGKTIRGTKAEIAVFDAEIPNGAVAVFLVEAVENIPEPDTDEPVDTDKPADTDEPATESPKTGDVLPYAAILMLLSGLAVLFVCKRKANA